MAGESDDLDKLFESVADGESVDWDALERSAPDEESRALIRQLRLIAEVADVHRSQVDEVTLAEDASMTIPPAGAGRLPIQAAGGRRVLPELSTTHGGAFSPAGAQPAPNLGVWGHLLLVRKIGEGSYGEVFHAHDTWLDHPVALKLLKPEAESRVQPSDLLHEARRLARVRHDNVVRVHGADRHNGRVGFWMDFIDGETLAARVFKGRMSAGEASSVGMEVCRALAAVHRASIIHRDVKAQNVMRAHDGGGIILMDFGAGEFQGNALATRPQGTPLYMAPELFESSAASVRTDIYAAGVLLFHLVTNAFPVNGGSMQELRDAHARGDRRRLRDERPDLPDSFIAIVERALDPDPMRRYATAGDMEAKLSGEPSTRPVPVPVPSPSPPPAPILKRVVAFVVGGVALTGVLGFIASRFFEVVLQIDRDLWFGFTDTFEIGMSGLFPYVSLWLFGAAVIGLLAALRTLFARPLSGPLAKLTGFLDAADPVRLATSIFMFAVGSWALVNLVVYRELFGALYALREAPIDTAIDLNILGPDRNAVRVSHLLLSIYLSMLLGLAVWRWFPKLERRSTAPTTQLMKWATLAVALMVIAWDVMPRRILWETHPVVEFENRTRFVIASTGDEPGDELLLYLPDEPAQPRVRVRRDTPGLKFLNEKRWLFSRNDSQRLGRSR